MSTGTKLKIAAQWFATGTLSALTIVFSVNAADIFFNHVGTPVQMRGYAFGATVFAFVAYQLYGMVREASDERARMRRSAGDGSALPTAAEAQAAAIAQAPEAFLLNAAGADATIARVERACPYCAERVLVAARLCRFCHSELIPLGADAGFEYARERVIRKPADSHHTPH